MALFDRLTKTAQDNKQRIVLAEGTEPRTLQAAEMLIADGIAEIILIGKPEQIIAKAQELSLNNIDKPTLLSLKNMPNYSTNCAKARESQWMMPAKLF